MSIGSPLLKHGGLSSLCIFHRGLGSNDEAASLEEKAERLLYYYPHSSSISEQLRKVNFLEGIIDFSQVFSPGQPVHSITMNKRRYVFLEVENQVWICVSLVRDQIGAVSTFENESVSKSVFPTSESIHSSSSMGTRGATSQHIGSSYSSDSVHDGTLRGILQGIYEEFILFYGKISRVINHPDAQRFLRKMAELRKLVRQYQTNCETIQANSDFKVARENSTTSQTTSSLSSNSEVGLSGVLSTESSEVSFVPLPLLNIPSSSSLDADTTRKLAVLSSKGAFTLALTQVLEKYSPTSALRRTLREFFDFRIFYVDWSRPNPFDGLSTLRHAPLRREIHQNVTNFAQKAEKGIPNIKSISLLFDGYLVFGSSHMRAVRALYNYLRIHAFHCVRSSKLSLNRLSLNTLQEFGLQTAGSFGNSAGLAVLVEESGQQHQARHNHDQQDGSSGIDVGNAGILRPRGIGAFEPDRRDYEYSSQELDAGSDSGRLRPLQSSVRVRFDDSLFVGNMRNYSRLCRAIRDTNAASAVPDEPLVTVLEEHHTVITETPTLDQMPKPPVAPSSSVDKKANLTKLRAIISSIPKSVGEEPTVQGSDASDMPAAPKKEYEFSLSPTRDYSYDRSSSQVPSYNGRAGVVSFIDGSRWSDAVSVNSVVIDLADVISDKPQVLLMHLTLLSEISQEMREKFCNKCYVDGNSRPRDAQFGVDSRISSNSDDTTEVKNDIVCFCSNQNPEIKRPKYDPEVALFNSPLLRQVLDLSTELTATFDMSELSPTLFRHTSNSDAQSKFSSQHLSKGSSVSSVASTHESDPSAINSLENIIGVKSKTPVELIPVSGNPTPSPSSISSTFSAGLPGLDDEVPIPHFGMSVRRSLSMTQSRELSQQISQGTSSLNSLNSGHTTMGSRPSAHNLHASMPPIPPRASVGSGIPSNFPTSGTRDPIHSSMNKPASVAVPALPRAAEVRGTLNKTVTVDVDTWPVLTLPYISFRFLGSLRNVVDALGGSRSNLDSDGEEDPEQEGEPEKSQQEGGSALKKSSSSTTSQEKAFSDLGAIRRKSFASSATTTSNLNGDVDADSFQSSAQTLSSAFDDVASPEPDQSIPSEDNKNFESSVAEGATANTVLNTEKSRRRKRHFMEYPVSTSAIGPQPNSEEFHSVSLHSNAFRSLSPEGKVHPESNHAGFSFSFLTRGLSFSSSGSNRLSMDLADAGGSASAGNNLNLMNFEASHIFCPPLFTNPSASEPTHRLLWVQHGLFTVLAFAGAQGLSDVSYFKGLKETLLSSVGTDVDVSRENTSLNSSPSAPEQSIFPVASTSSDSPPPGSEHQDLCSDLNSLALLHLAKSVELVSSTLLPRLETEVLSALDIRAGRCAAKGLESSKSFALDMSVATLDIHGLPGAVRHISPPTPPPQPVKGDKIPRKKRTLFTQAAAVASGDSSVSLNYGLMPALSIAQAAVASPAAAKHALTHVKKAVARGWGSRKFVTLLEGYNAFSPRLIYRHVVLSNLKTYTHSKHSGSRFLNIEGGTPESSPHISRSSSIGNSSISSKLSGSKTIVPDSEDILLATRNFGMISASRTDAKSVIVVLEEGSDDRKWDGHKDSDIQDAMLKARFIDKVLFSRS